MIFTTIRLEAEKPKPEYYPENPQSIGEHICKARVDRKLLQEDVANILGVDVMTIGNWENGKVQPKSRFLIPVIQFLGYTPKCLQDYPQLESPVFAYRMKHSYTQEQLARLTGLDKTTIQAVEMGKRPMIDRTRKKLVEHQII